MYKQFTYYPSINTSERQFKYYIKSNKYYRFKPKPKYNWVNSIKKNTYFLEVPLLISNKTSKYYYTDTKCCSPYHVNKKKKFIYNL